MPPKKPEELDFGKLLATGALSLNYSPHAQYQGPVMPGTSEQAFRTTGRTITPQGKEIRSQGTLGAATTDFSNRGGSTQQSQQSQPAQQDDYGMQLALQAFEAGKNQARGIRDQGQRVLQTLLDSVNRFRDRSKEQFINAGQEIVNNSAQQLGSNARTKDELVGTARARGRALGLGDSSRFNTQNRIDANLASTQGSVLANRGENERSNRSIYDQRLDTAQGQENQANNYLGDINNYANQVESANVGNYAGALNSLLQRQQALQSLQPLNAGGLAQYQMDNSGITNTLNGLLGGITGGPVQGEDIAANPVLSPYDDWRRLLQQG